MPNGDGTLVMEGAELVFPNFSGKEGPYNREGDRNFCVILPPDLAEEMNRDGWNVKTLKPRQEGDEPRDYIQVSVGYKYRPPLIVLITSKGRTTIPSAEDLDPLDWVDIKNVDLIIRPYSWSVRGETGIKAYLQSLYITIYEDPLMLKYMDVPQLGSSGEPLQIDSRPHADFEGEVV